MVNPVIPIPVAAPYIQANYSSSNTAPATSTEMTQDQLSTLSQQGFPEGLARELFKSKATYPLRFWVVDNSGSMQTNDGHMIRGTKNNIIVTPCNRWTELQDTVEYHVQLAGLLKVTTVFRMLNDPGALVGPQECTVGDTTAGMDMAQQVQQALSVIQKSEPNGVTPLTDHVKEFRARIQDVVHDLRRQGQKAVIVLATDGLPSDKYGTSSDQIRQEFVEALRSLQPLPVWVVIRLCTDNDDIAEFYNNLDSILELPLEVIDDFLGEAAEIYKANKWLNYALPLHRCREMGYQSRIFDLLDERRLNKDELVVFLKLLFGDDAFRSVPNAHENWKGFCAALDTIVRKNKQQWNPMSKRKDYWIDMKKLKKAFGGGGDSCVIL